MKAQSLYSYFDSKDAIYDALFQRGATEMFGRYEALETTADARADARAGARMFFDFCTEDPARYQLMFQRTIPGFEPSAEAYAPSVETYERMRERMAEAGGDRPEDLDLWTALLTGLVDQQLSNDPGGDRWHRLLNDAVDMFFARIDARAKGDTR